MATITVKQFVMLLTSQSIVSSASHMTPNISSSNPYRRATPIMRIYCADGESLSVQAHGGCHVIFADVNPRNGIYSCYSPTFGKELVMCETDCEELDQYGIDDIEDIEKYVESLDITLNIKEKILINVSDSKDKVYLDDTIDELESESSFIKCK